MPTKTPEDIEVTGNCYENSANEQIRKADWLMVHGRPTRQIEPYCEFGHAWLEKDERVHDPTSGFEGPRWLYYSFGKIDHKHNLVYDIITSRRLLLITEHYGPWEGVDGTPPTEEQLKYWRGELPEPALKSQPPVYPSAGAPIHRILGELESNGGVGNIEGGSR